MTYVFNLFVIVEMTKFNLLQSNPKLIKYNFIFFPTHIWKMNFIFFFIIYNLKTNSTVQNIYIIYIYMYNNYSNIYNIYIYIWLEFAQNIIHYIIYIQIFVNNIIMRYTSLANIKKFTIYYIFSNNFSKFFTVHIFLINF